MNKTFGNRLIIIDEVHNIRITDDNKDKQAAMALFDLVKRVKNIKLLLLSGTPMYNSYKEITWLINLMNLNDQRELIEEKDVFNANGDFQPGGQELLERKATGYISFVRGENPYTFPYRIWPKEFSPTNAISNHEMPRYQMNHKPIMQNVGSVLDIYMSNIGPYQQVGYDYIIESIDGEEFEKMQSFGYTILQRPIESLNMIYPDDRLDAGMKNFDHKDLVGKAGLSRIMKFEERTNPPSRFNFEYRNSKYGRVFSPPEIGKYSGKIKQITEHIINSTGVVLVYSQYIDGGLVPVALALEELGFKRAGKTKSLLKEQPTNSTSVSMKYIMITGDITLSPNNVEEYKMLTNENNKDGQEVKVVLISQAGSEGLDFKFIRQVHILEPWYNMNRIEQIIGRAVRTCSHKSLPFRKRNVEIYLYGTLLSDKSYEAVDVYVYRVAENKALQIGKISRILKQISVDCLLNSAQNNFTVEQMNKTVTLELSTANQEIQYAVGDKPLTAICDYMTKCAFTCKPDKKLEEQTYTYNEYMIRNNAEKIIQRIRSLMKESYVYDKTELVSRINAVKQYPLVQIYAALTQLIDDKNEFITDKYDRLGRLINIGDMYFFQPQELNNENISMHDRSTPIEYKRPHITYHIQDKAIEQKSELVDELLETYTIATTPQILLRGETNVYKFFYSVLKNFKHRDELLINHLIEKLNPEHTTMLLNDLERRKRTEFEDKLYHYFEMRIMNAKKIKGFMLPDTNILIYKEGQWVAAEGEDKNDLRDEIFKIINRIKPESKLNDIIGFNTLFKKDSVVFKVKDMKHARDTGARCDQSVKNKIVKTLNKILDNTETYKDINQKQICILEEFYLRLFDKIKKNNKVWFLSPCESKLLNL